MIAWAGIVVLPILAAAVALATGPSGLDVAGAWRAFAAFDDTTFEHFVIREQRLPRVFVAAFVGACLAASGAVLQSLTRNPLAAPSILGVSAGATLAVVVFAVLPGLSQIWHGPIAVIGGLSGFGLTIVFARIASGGRDPRGLSLILAGAIVSIFLSGIVQALLIADPALRQALLGWITGNVNHVYAERLWQTGWLGAAALIMMLGLGRPLTILSLGEEIAQAAGVNARLTARTALLAVVCATGSAVAICGPVGFVGLVVPHMVKPFVGAHLGRMIPACICVGAAVLIVADTAARTLFAPIVLHTGVITEILGGVVFILIVRRQYVVRGRWSGA